MVQSLLRLANLDWPVPDFSTVCRRQRHLCVQLSYRPSTAPLHLLVDSTALLRNVTDGRCGPSPRRSYAMATVTGRPSWLKRLSNTTRTCSSTT